MVNYGSQSCRGRSGEWPRYSHLPQHRYMANIVPGQCNQADSQGEGQGKLATVFIPALSPNIGSLLMRISWTFARNNAIDRERAWIHFIKVWSNLPQETLDRLRRLETFLQTPFKDGELRNKLLTEKTDAEKVSISVCSHLLPC